MSRVRSLFVLWFVGCAPSLVESPEADSDRPPSFAFEGEELAAELAGAPTRKADTPFTRLGVTWDSDAPTAIEISTSLDGERWEAWRSPVVAGHELEGTSAAFVGAIDVAEPAQYFRIRGRGATFVGIELLSADAPESGDAPVAPAEPGALAAVNSRASWGARAAKCSTSQTPNRFTIHHTVTPTTDTLSPQARLRNIQAYHQDVRGWCDIGYNFLVSRDGRLWEGRGAAKVGSHVAGQNTGNIGVSFLGTYTTVSATTTQLANAGQLIGELAQRHGIARDRATIKGHRERGQTDCPGDKLFAQLGAIVTASRGGTSGPGPAPGPTTVKGVVYRGADPTSRVAGATVTLGDRTTTTSSTGYYELADVIGATFRVTATAPGFAASSIDRAPAGAETWASISLAPQ